MERKKETLMSRSGSFNREERKRVYRASPSLLPSGCLASASPRESEETPWLEKRDIRQVCRTSLPPSETPAAVKFPAASAAVANHHPKRPFDQA